MECSQGALTGRKRWRGQYGGVKGRAITKKAVAWSLWSVQSARNHEKIRGAVTKEFSQHQCGRLENEKILELDNPFDSIYHSVIMLIRSSDDLMTHSEIGRASCRERV